MIRDSRLAFFAPLLILLFALPLVSLLSGSLKSPGELVANPFRLIPQRTRAENYRDAAAVMPLARYLINTAILCGLSAVGTACSCTLAGYAFARLQWRGRQLLFGIMIGTMLLPWHITMIPRFLLIQQLGLYNTLAAIWLPTFLGNAFYIFLMRQYFLILPTALAEAGRLDGLGEWGVFWRIFSAAQPPRDRNDRGLPGRCDLE